jgi:hypothetical protein
MANGTHATRFATRSTRHAPRKGQTPTPARERVRIRMQRAANPCTDVRHDQIVENIESKKMCTKQAGNVGCNPQCQKTPRKAAYDTPEHGEGPAPAQGEPRMPTQRRAPRTTK